MKKLTVSILALTVFATLSPGVYAKGDKENDSIKKQIEDFSVGKKGVQTISSQELLDKIEGPSRERDLLRESQVMSNLRRDSSESKIEEIKSLKEKKVEEFILNNVPAHILASGDSAVQAYIMENFTAPPIDEDKNKVNTLWKSTNDAIAIPITNSSQNWAPQTQTVSEPIQVIETAAPEKDDGLDDKELTALAKLGITEEELAKMLGNEKPTKASEVEQVKPEPKPEKKAEVEVQSANVIIDDIKIERLVIMGKSTFIDANIQFKELRGDLQRKISRKFKKMKEGVIFEIEGNRFELISIKKDQVVFQNIDTHRSYRKIVD